MKLLKGTSWVEEIVWLLKNNLDYEAAKSKFHFSRVTFVDSGCSEKRAELLPSPRIFKTHLPLKFLPDNIEKKIKVCLKTIEIYGCIFWIMNSLLF